MQLPRLITRFPLWLLLLLVVIGLGVAGCASTESANDSPRPWSSPEGWQNGMIPGALTEPH